MQSIGTSYALGAELATDNVFLSIRPRDEVAFCGRARRRKSSLLLALLRLMDLETGPIELWWIDINSMAHDDSRARLMAVPQEPSPVTPTEEQTSGALQKAELSDRLFAHGNLVTDVSEFQLSRGQEQLLMPARAIVQKNPQRTPLYWTRL
ncbi:hypothetical protein BJ170DRAFT_686766 [Xylariales sp. AK1849]|nr:hypothetical protein BJ170DRAFT_686766 [Xylariales sp. AK1849]